MQSVSTVIDSLSDREFEKRESAIDSEELREEQIANHAHELAEKRKAAMEPIDIVAGMQSVLEVAAAKIRPHLLAGRVDYVGAMVRALIDLYIEQDCEVIANDWMDRIERELSAWEH